MIKKTITYTDYNGVERTENFFFNLTPIELTEMNLSAGGMKEKFETIVASRDDKQILETFKEILCKAYGVKSPDGRRFIKNQNVLEEFTQTEAYSLLFIELASNAEAAAAFVRGIIPQIPNPPPAS